MIKRLALPPFLHHEAAGGITLFLAAVAALALANSPLAAKFASFLEFPLKAGIAPLVLEKTLGHWINDGLMVIFFFIVGLEIKRELVVGALSSAKQAALPLAAAAGGMIVPALIYVFINRNDPVALNGWAIPCATDIAFAVGVLALLGSRIPPALKIFLLALAIIDDLGAILIIAAFYTADLSLNALGLASVGIAALVALNRSGVTRIAPYVAVGFFVWLCVLKSGVHATLAGVITALTIPLSQNGEEPDEHSSPALWLQHTLHPWVTFVVLPLFALANAGVSFSGFSLNALGASIPLGIILGLVIGKPVGVFTFSWIAIKAGVAERPDGATWLQILGIGVIAGIGFTMSLFIGMLAFPDSNSATEIRLGVLAASSVAGVLGYLILRSASPWPKSD
jgi:Na+:H+ antiporter, NhaA family